MIINHNLPGLNAIRQMNTNSATASKSMQKLSSGLRINGAADDAAGLSISEKMKGQIRGLDQASSNAQDGISLTQTAEGALGETTSILQRMRELAVQGSNDTNTTDDRTAIQTEMNQLTSEINRIGNTTEFNKKTLLNGDYDLTTATAGTSKGSMSLTGAIAGSGVIITDTPTAGSVTAGAYGQSGVTAAKDTAASVTGNIAANLIAIGATNQELTLSVKGNEFHVTFTSGVGAGASALADINAQLATTVGSATASFDSSNHLVISNTTLGSTGSVQIKGGGFATAFLSTDLTTITTTQGKDAGDVWVHGSSSGNETGSVVMTNASLSSTNIVISSGNNELTLKINGTEHTINLLSGTTYNGSAGADTTQLLSDLNTALDTAFGVGSAVASLDSSNKLVITAGSVGTSSTVEITGGGLADTLFGTAGTRIIQDGQAANDTLSFSVNGSSKSVAIADQTYQDLNEFISVNSAAFSGAGVTATNDGGVLKLTSKTTGNTSNVTGFTDSDLTRQLGLVKTSAASAGATLDAGNFIAGANGNTTLDITVDGSAVHAVIQTGTYKNKDTLAAAVKNAINDATTNAADVNVSVNASGNLEITSGSTGSASQITIGTNPTLDAAGILGLTTNTATAGTNQANAELEFQIGANEHQSMGLKIGDMRASALGIVGTGSAFTSTNGVTDGTNSSAVQSALDVSSATNAAKAITTIDAAISKVSAERSKLGAVQNRLEHTIANLGTASENLTTAQSRITDVDMAKEMATFSKNNILSQAAQAMLAQANQQPQQVLQLLR